MESDIFTGSATATDLSSLIGTPSFSLPEFLLGIPSLNCGTSSSLMLSNATVFEIQNLKGPVVLLPPKLYNQFLEIKKKSNGNLFGNPTSPGVITPDLEEHKVFEEKYNANKSVRTRTRSASKRLKPKIEHYGENKDNITIFEDISPFVINPDGILSVKETDSDFAILEKLSLRIMGEKKTPLPSTKARKTVAKKRTTTKREPPPPIIQVPEKEKGLTCQTCNKTLASLHSYEMHLKIHADIKEYVCKTCNKEFRWKSSYENHMYVHRKGKKYKCNNCENSYAYKAGLDQHIASKHSNTQKIYNCEHCPKHFMSLTGLKVHQESKHQEGPAEIFICENCGKRMASKSSLRNHQVTHTGEKKHECKDCHTWFGSYHTLKRHRLKVHLGKWEKKFQCGQCGKLYYTSSQLRSHEIMHTDARPFKCKDCDRTFRSYTHLRGHKNIHLGIKPNKCTYCSKTFTFHANMLKHMKRHGNNRNHHCELCPKRFFEKQELRKHMASHDKIQDKVDNMLEDPGQSHQMDIANYCLPYPTYQML